MMTESDILKAMDVSHGLVTVPPGEYEISSPIEIRDNNCSVYGPQATLFPGKRFPDGEPLIKVVGRSRDARRNWVRIEGLRIEGRGRNIIGIYSDHTFRMSLLWLRINSVKGIGLAIGNAQDLRVRDCDIRNSGDYEQSRPSMLLFGDQAPVEGLPPNHPGANTVNIESCTIERYSGTALSASDQTVMRITDVKCHGQNEDRKQSRVGMSLSRCDRVQITRCHTVLAAEFDYQFNGCRDVEIHQPFTSQGRDVKWVSDGGVLLM